MMPLALCEFFAMAALCLARSAGFGVDAEDKC
jgi:hypothetical protein